MVAKRYLILPLAGAAIVAGCGSSGSSGTGKTAAVAPKPSGGKAGHMMSVDTGARLAVGAPRPDTVVRATDVPFDVRLRASSWVGDPSWCFMSAGSHRRWTRERWRPGATWEPRAPSTLGSKVARCASSDVAAPWSTVRPDRAGT